MRVKVKSPTEIPSDLVKTIEEIGREMDLEEVIISAFVPEELPGTEKYEDGGPFFAINEEQPQILIDERIFQMDNEYKRGYFAAVMARFVQRKLSYEKVIKDIKNLAPQTVTNEENALMIDQFLDVIHLISADQIAIEHGYVKGLYHARKELLKRREQMLPIIVGDRSDIKIERYLTSLVKFYVWVPFSLCSKTKEANELKELSKSQVEKYLTRVSDVYESVGNIFLNCGNPLTHEKVKDSVKKFFDVYISLI